MRIIISKGKLTQQKKSYENYYFSYTAALCFESLLLLPRGVNKHGEWFRTREALGRLLGTLQMKHLQGRPKDCERK